MLQRWCSMYNCATGKVLHWGLPELDPPGCIAFESGACFIAEGQELLVCGLCSFFCVLQIPDMKILRVSQKKIRPKQNLIADATGALSGDTPSSDIGVDV